MNLIRYEHARAALKECVTVDEAKEIADKAAALQLYARQHQDKDMECWVAEIKIRAKRRIGEISSQLERIEPQDSGAMAHKRGGHTGVSTSKGKRQALKEAGVDRETARRCEKMAKVSEEKFEQAIAELKEQDRPITYRDIEKVAAPNVHVANNSGENEWYTPPNLVEAARSTMGSIDLDPASCKEANKTVNATRYYSAENDGLAQPWSGNVWMNPPYESKLIAPFIEKLVDELELIDQACVLVNNATETKWFQKACSAANALCLIKGRVQFISTKTTKKSAPLQGQIVLYFGRNLAEFNDNFSNLGVILYGIQPSLSDG